MYDLSPEAVKARENANTRQCIQEAHADRGPYLSDDGAVLVIPSPARHPRLNRVLRTYDFRFEWYDIPGPMWTRDTDKPHRGKRYSSDAWLQWARIHYAKAWPKWDGCNEQEDRR
jgi:hypothetical protein